MLLPEMMKGEHQQELLLMNQVKNQTLATGKPGIQVKPQQRKPECDGFLVEKFDRRGWHTLLVFILPIDAIR